MSFMGNMIGNKALAAHGKNEYEKALQLYNEAYEKGMDKPRLLRGYSVLLIRMGRLDRALEVLKKIEALPGLTPAEKTDLHVNYAIILSQKGHLDRAMDILEDEFRHLKNGTMYSIFGYLKVEQGDAEAALAFNREALCFSMYSLMSIRTMFFSSSNNACASALASSVLPTPVGPRKRNEPIGLFGFWMPARLRRMASQTFSTASS